METMKEHVKNRKRIQVNIGVLGGIYQQKTRWHLDSCKKICISEDTIDPFVVPWISFRLATL